MRGPTIVARRWDRLGARLIAMLNAWSIAHALGLEFRFVWPRGADPDLDDPRGLFDARFLDAFEMDPSALEGTVVVPGFRPEAVTASVARRLWPAGARHVVDVEECIDVLAFLDEDPALARARFRERFDAIGWRPEIRTVVERFASWSNDEGCAAIHVRAGDVVTGEWRHFIPYEKYIPTPLVDLAIEALSGSAGTPVLVLSDNDEYTDLLSRRHDVVRTPRDLFARYDRLTAMQRALADILVLSRCRAIVTPARSAFSRLAAHLGAKEVVPAHALVPPAWEEQDFLRRGITRVTQGLPYARCRKPLLARDLCWYLDVFGETLPVTQQRDLARRAVDLEPDLSGALARSARVAALAGDHGTARLAARRAVRIAESVRRHHDPLVEGLGTSIAAGCLALAEDPGAHRSAKVDELRQMLARCEEAPPYQMDHPDILMNLRYQIAAVEWLVAGNVRRAIVPERDFDRAAWRASSLACLRRVTLFDPVLRDLERVTIGFSRVVAAVVSLTSQDRDAPVMGRLDEVATSRSGLTWIHGWAAGGRRPEPARAVALLRDGRSTCGGPVFLPRPDVAEHFGDPALAVSGFAFPVPLDTPADVPLVALTAAGTLQRLC